MGSIEPRYIATAISDLILALVSFSCAINPKLDRLGLHTAAGFGLVGIAACCGVVRFGVIIPPFHNTIIKLHKVLSWLASVAASFSGQFGEWSIGQIIVGKHRDSLPLIAAGLCFHHQKQSLGNLHLATAGASLLLCCLRISINDNLSKLVSTSAVLGIAFVSILEKNLYGIAGTIAYMLAGGLESIDDILGLRGVDWFHYALAIGNVLFMCAIIT